MASGAGPDREHDGVPVGQRDRPEVIQLAFGRVRVGELGELAAGDADVREPVRLPGRAEDQLVPVVVQSAPLSDAPSAMVTGALPSSRTFFSLPLASNASHCPSGENSGWAAGRVPGMGCPSSWSLRRE